MPLYPSCRKCALCISLEVLINEYDGYRITLTQANVKLISDHARGHVQGQTAALREVLNELWELLPYMQNEWLLRQQEMGE